MDFAIGLDIGGTKIAGAVFDPAGHEVTQLVQPTPMNYPDFLAACEAVIRSLDAAAGNTATLGIGVPYGVANMPFLVGQDFGADLSARLGRSVRVGNDANCAALAEAMDGAGRGHNVVFGLIMGTGVAGGLVINGRVLEGRHGLAGEIGHLPLPYYVPEDGELVACGCGQVGCIEKLICGAALARLFQRMMGREASAVQIADAARDGNADALWVLDHYYTVVAKAMVTIIHAYDPDIITVSGGLNALPALYDKVPERWSRYTIAKNITTKFVPAQHGAMAGLRGAAWLGRNGV